MVNNGNMLTNCVQILHTEHNAPDDSYCVDRVTCRGIIVKEGKLLISHETKDELFLIPGGGMENGESPEECCTREVFEETGYRTDPVKHIADVHMYFSSSKFINHFFECKIVSRDKPHLLDYEIELGLRPDWYDIDEIYRVFADYKKYKNTDPERYILYQREFLALDWYFNHR